MEIGISQISLALPSFFIRTRKLAQKRNLDPDYAHKGIGVFENRILYKEKLEDLGLRALKKINLNDVERFFIATESDSDASKPLGVKILSALEKNQLSFQLKFACLGGLEALLLAHEYVYTHKKPAVVLALDRSIYSSQDPKAEITQGACAVALRIEAKPKVISFNFKQFGQYADDLDDFKVPFCFFPFPRVNGELTKPVYLECLKKAVEDWKKKKKLKKSMLDYFDFFIMHTPFPKIVEWAGAMFWRHEKKPKEKFGLEKCIKNPKLFEKYKKEIDEIRKKEDFRNFFQQKILPGLKYNPYVGNSYTCSIFVSLVGVLEEAKRGQKIALSGYGSGAGSLFLEGTIKKNFKSDIQKQLKNGKEISINEYEKWKKNYVHRKLS